MMGDEEISVILNPLQHGTPRKLRNQFRVRLTQWRIRTQVQVLGSWPEVFPQHTERKGTYHKRKIFHLKKTSCWDQGFDSFLPPSAQRPFKESAEMNEKNKVGSLCL